MAYGQSPSDGKQLQTHNINIFKKLVSMLFFCKRHIYTANVLHVFQLILSLIPHSMMLCQMIDSADSDHSDLDKNLNWVIPAEQGRETDKSLVTWNTTWFQNRKIAIISRNARQTESGRKFNCSRNGMSLLNLRLPLLCRSRTEQEENRRQLWLI